MELTALSLNAILLSFGFLNLKTLGSLELLKIKHFTYKSKVK